MLDEKVHGFETSLVSANGWELSRIYGTETWSSKFRLYEV